MCPTAKPTCSFSLTIMSDSAIAIGSSVVRCFLEDDFQVPDTISPSDVFFTQTGKLLPVQAPPHRRVRVIVDSDDLDHTGPDAHTDPRLCSRHGFRPMKKRAASWTGEFTLRITKEAGIRNDTEAGTYGPVAYQLLSTSVRASRATGETKLAVNGPAADKSNLVVLAKVALSDENNKRGYELNIVGSGLNSGRTATAYVLEDYPGSMPGCDTVVAMGESVGSAGCG